jgi:hypothetical protein
MESTHHTNVPEFTEQARRGSGSRLSSSVLLWASAFVLAGLIVMQAGRFGGEARAEVVASTGGLTALTFTATSSEDMLAVIDSRSEELFIYRVENQSNLELYRRYNLPRMFTDARAQGAGRR